MRPTLTLTLSPALRDRAERFFGADLGGVRLHIGPAPCRAGTWAWTYGDQVFLHPALLALPWRNVVEVIGHELTHVLQQRQGRQRRVPRDRFWQARLRACERQAERLGRAFAASSAADRVAGRRSIEPMAAARQCAVAVGGRTLWQVDNLSPKAQTLFGLIQGAERWLSWAVTAGPRFQYDDEPSLLTAVQAGLYRDPLTLLRRLGVLVHPRKLWTLSAEHLGQTLAYERDDAENTVLGSNLTQVLHANGILAASDFAAVHQFLSQIGRAEQPVFQALSVADQTALLDLVKTPPNVLALDRHAQEQAAAFAIESAQNVVEFAELYAFFFAVALRLERERDRQWSSDPDLPAVRRAAQRARDVLSEQVQPFLVSPVVAQVPSTVELYALLNRWTDQRRRLGFPTVASAMRQLAASDLPDSPAHMTEESIETFVDGAQRFARSIEPSRCVLSQDGTTYRYELLGKSGLAHVDISRDGCVTLAAYRPR